MGRYYLLCQLTASGLHPEGVALVRPHRGGSPPAKCCSEGRSRHQPSTTAVELATVGSFRYGSRMSGGERTRSPTMAG